MHDCHTKRTCQYTCSLAHANAMALAHTFELDVADTLTLRNSSHRGSGPTLTLVLKVTGSALSDPTKAASPTQPTPSCSVRPTSWPISRCVFWANFGHVSGRPRAHVRVMAIRPSCTGSSLSGYDNIAAGCWLTALSRMCGLHPDSASARPCLFPAKLGPRVKQRGVQNFEPWRTITDLAFAGAGSGRENTVGTWYTTVPLAFNRGRHE